jgi:hypothetical protein
MSDTIERVNILRARLKDNGTLSVKEVTDLLDEVEQVHKSREAAVYSYNQLHAQFVHKEYFA